MRTFTTALVAAAVLTLAGSGAAAAESPLSGSGAMSGSGAVAATAACSLVRLFVIFPGEFCDRYPFPGVLAGS